MVHVGQAHLYVPKPDDRMTIEGCMTNDAKQPAWSAGSVDIGRCSSATDLHELLTVAEVAALLKVSKSWVYEHTRSKRLPRAESLPYLKIGKYVRFNAQHIQEFLSRRSRVA